jgi:tetratricopeptide (TPR) repeat protein
MRASPVLLIVVVVGALAAPAAADTDIVVLGPALVGKVTGAHVRHVKKALELALPAQLRDRAIDATCVSDPQCLAAAGGQLGARRVVAVSIADGSGEAITIGLALVDVGAKDLVGKRDVSVTDRRLNKDLGAAIKKFIEEAPIERAKVLFSDGNQHYNLGEFPQALELYKAAYRVKPLAAFLFNIAQCHRKLGQHQDAITMYQSYLAGVPDAQNRALTESLIAESRERLAEERKQADARITEDARREGERLAAEKKKAEDERKAREAEAVAAVEKRKAEQARIEREREQEQEKLYNKHPARKWTFVTGGLGAAAVIAGGIFGYSARSAQSSFDNAGCGDPTRVLGKDALAQCRQDSDSGKRDALFGNVGLIGGGALLLTSAMIFVIDPGNLERPDMARARVAISPTSVQVVLQW